MKPEEKLKAIAKWIEDFLQYTDLNDSDKKLFTASELSEIKGGRRLALDLCVRFHLEAFLENE